MVQNSCLMNSCTHKWKMINTYRGFTQAHRHWPPQNGALKLKGAPADAKMRQAVPPGNTLFKNSCLNRAAASSHLIGNIWTLALSIPWEEIEGSTDAYIRSAAMKDPTGIIKFLLLNRLISVCAGRSIPSLASLSSLKNNHGSPGRTRKRVSKYHYPADVLKTVIYEAAWHTRKWPLR